MEKCKLISVEVAYAKPDVQHILKINLENNSSIAEAIHCSGILKIFPEINLATQAVGVFGQVKKLTDIVNDGDRIEIYRSLSIDPKIARIKRVAASRK